MEIHLVREPVALATIDGWAREQFGEMIKAVLDIERGVIAIGGELHADEGINLYPGQPEADWLEFDAMINVRPAQGNRSRGVDDPALRDKIAAVVKRIILRP